MMFPVSGQIAEQGPESERGGLRLAHVYLIFFCWTIFSVYLYSHFSTLGDSQGYLTGAYDDDDTAPGPWRSEKSPKWRLRCCMPNSSLICFLLPLRRPACDI